ncbi:hypothetical protein G7054_g10505 [Neopestalotiopsis clavispora]|jgi:hypothetical protein|nr:hypothetical protein E8E14_014466 [Neopestalotiopsis sp. 37M]KAF7527330.1 hypothetical protein G7054_g10505 [Neopestalotiopsis clavispora]
MSPSNTTFTKAWTAVKRHAKEHHQSVNAAYASYYGTTGAPLPISNTNSPAAKSPAASVTAAPASVSETPRSSVDKAWSKVKKHVKEHHRSVNAAHAAYYGTSPAQTPNSSVESSPRVSVDRH